jgi:hypothetical protein
MFIKSSNPAGLYVYRNEIWDNWCDPGPGRMCIVHIDDYKHPTFPRSSNPVKSLKSLPNMPLRLCWAEIIWAFSPKNTNLFFEMEY